MIDKFPVAIREGIMSKTLVAARSPATRNDLCFHDITYAAVANPNTPRGTTGANHAGPVPGYNSCLHYQGC